MIFLLILTLGFYYVMKGVIVKETKALFIITSIAFVINLLVLNGMDNGWVKVLAMIYLIYSFIEYLSLTYSKKPLYDLPYMSVVSVINEEVIVNYKIFKLILILPFNMYMFLRKQPRIGMNDEIGIDVNAKDGTKVKIKL